MDLILPVKLLIVHSRPHNSGHYTIEACPTMNQYKAQLLSILGIMPPMTKIPSMFPATIMLNILGGASKSAHTQLMKQAVAIPTAALHMYGKESKPARKIGHITVVAMSMSQGKPFHHFSLNLPMLTSIAEQVMNPLITLADGMRAVRKSISPPAPSPVVFTEQPLVAVTMGSDSDLPVLKPGIALLKTLGIPYLVTITSAHRTPHRMIELAETAADKGFKVIIAAAGGAAHLPGMIASSTPLPGKRSISFCLVHQFRKGGFSSTLSSIILMLPTVIGVPVKASTLDGMDSLLSIVQMPRGVPVATVAINNSVCFNISALC